MVVHAPKRIVLCQVDGLPDPGAKGVLLGSASDTLDLIVVRQGSTIRAFHNACPHQGTPLETFPGRFLDDAGEHLVCSTHGARFRLADGHCVSGPCEGGCLRAIEVVLEDGAVVLAEKPELEGS